MNNFKKNIFKIYNVEASPPSLLAVDDNTGITISTIVSDSYEVDVLANDSLGVPPTNIINVSAISPPTAGLTVSIAGDNQSVFIDVTIPGYVLNSGQVYTFTYTIEDSTSAQSTATVSFEDIS